MYVLTAFREHDLVAMHRTMQQVRLANLVTNTPEPLLLVPNEGPFGTLYGHVARANPQWKLQPTGAAMVLFSGPDAYVMPSWYSSKQEHQKVVPTWNYVAIHAYDSVDFYDDADHLLNVVTRLTNRHEQPRAVPWAVTDAPEAFIHAQFKGIVGLRLPITRLEGKRKMSQNRSAEDRAGIAAGLAAMENASNRAVAALVQVLG